LAFPLKSLKPLNVASHFVWKDFDRDSVTQQSMSSTIDRSHSAFCDKCFNLILIVEYSSDHFRMIVSEHFAVAGAKTHRIAVSSPAFLASFHAKQY
jgi:hypothetical protein